MTTGRTSRSKPTPTSIAFDSPCELDKVQRAARMLGKSVSRYLRELATRDADRVLNEACPHCGSGKHAAA